MHGQICCAARGTGLSGGKLQASLPGHAPWLAAARGSKHTAGHVINYTPSRL